MDNGTDISVVVPVYNEREVLPHLYERLASVLEGLGMSYEIIFVNDASTDDSLHILRGLHERDGRVKILSFSRNFGHQTAVTAGLNFSRGRAVVVMDGDLQDPPECIPAFVARWREGNEVVYGVRRKRKESLMKRALYKVYYRVLRLLSKVDIPLDSGDFCLMDRKVVELLNHMPERNRFVRGLRRWVGFRQAGVPYERDARYAGESKYTFFKLVKLALDGIVSFSELPLKASVLIGFAISIMTVVYSFYLIVNRIVHPANQIPGWTSIIVAVTFLGGIELMVMGFLGEYLLRIYDEVKDRPQYILNGVIGFEEKGDAEGVGGDSGLQRGEVHREVPGLSQGPEL
ncbi:MAG TPA: glycosyltransferase [Deltaproteobacteria bacterium]|nr:glycosyltransferase [Deltaproteobacteria bacterium]